MLGKKSHQSYTRPGTQWGCEISSLQGIQILTRQGSEQPDLAGPPLAGDLTRWFPEVPSNIHCSKSPLLSQESQYVQVMVASLGIETDCSISVLASSTIH